MVHILSKASSAAYNGLWVLTLGYILNLRVYFVFNLTEFANVFNSGDTIRVLVFNCTSGRSGASFLSSMHSTISTQLDLHRRTETSESFFTHVIFCTNVTYADGHFKGGMCCAYLLSTDYSVNIRFGNLFNPKWWSRWIEDTAATRIGMVGTSTKLS